MVWPPLKTCELTQSTIISTLTSWEYSRVPSTLSRPMGIQHDISSCTTRAWQTLSAHLMHKPWKLLDRLALACHTTHIPCISWTCVGPRLLLGGRSVMKYIPKLTKCRIRISDRNLKSKLWGYSIKTKSGDNECFRNAETWYPGQESIRSIHEWLTLQELTQSHRNNQSGERWDYECKILHSLWIWKRVWRLSI